MVLRRFALFLLVFLTFSTVALAQKADVSFVVGGAFASDASVPPGSICPIPCPTPFTFKTQHHVFYEGTGAVRLANLKLVSLHLEVPVAVIPSAGVDFSGIAATVPVGSSGLLKLSTLFITPSLRVKLAPTFPLSPFVSIGGGLAHYHGDVPSENKGALQFGGGVDIKTGIPLLGFRAEVRDFVTGQPNFGIVSAFTNPSQPTGSRRHNVLAGGGIVLRF